MNASHPLVFSPRTSFNHAISSTDTTGAILIGLSSTAITAFAYSIVTRLLAHRPTEDISYDHWLRNMIFQAGFSKSLLTWLHGGDVLRKSHYKDNRKPIHLSRLISPLTLKLTLTVFTVSLIFLSIPRDVEFRSDQGVGIAAYLGGDGTDLIPFEATLCKAFPRDLGRYTQLIDLQLCLPSIIKSEDEDFDDDNSTSFSILKELNEPFFTIAASRGRNNTSSLISLFMLTPADTLKEIELNIRDATHENIAKVVRNGLRNFECELKDEPISSTTDGHLGVRNFSSWEVKNCPMDVTRILALASQAIAGSIFVTTNNSETIVRIHEDQVGALNTTLSRYEGPIIMGTEPVLGVATLLLLAGILFVLDLVLSLIKPGESDTLSVIAPLVREVAGIDCLDNPLQAEKGKFIKFNRVMRGKEGHLGYVLKSQDLHVPEFPEGTTVRASAPSDTPGAAICRVTSIDCSFSKQIDYVDSAV